MTKKTFIENINKEREESPALMFISTADKTKETNTETPSRHAPEGYKINPEYIELKTKRVQLILQPSLYSKVKATAQAKNLSVNEFCHRVLEEATKGE